MACKANSCSRPAREDGYCLTHSPERQRAVRKANGDRFKGYALKRDYGISLEDYNELLTRQEYRCAICGRPDGDERGNNNGSKRLAVDHDHETEEVRGLLCSMCNKGIGSLDDSPELLLKAYEYLIGYRKRREITAELADSCIDELLKL